MALVPITQYPPQIPDPRGAEVAAPLSAGVVGGIADALNHDIGWRQLRQGNWVVERRHDYTLGGVLTEDPSGKGSQQFPFLFFTSPRAEYLQVLVTYQTRKAPLAGPRLDVWLSTIAGATVDGTSIAPAFRWDFADGTMTPAEGTSGEVALGVSFTTYPVVHGNTGIVTNDTPASPTTPRCLNLTTFAGQALVVWLQETDCRLLTVCVKELYKEQVDQ